MKKKERWTEDHDPEGRYANFFRIGFNSDVFVIDHYQYFPVDCEKKTEAELKHIPRLRIIIAPADARQLFENLKVCIEDYEKCNGIIGKSNGFE